MKYMTMLEKGDGFHVELKGKWGEVTEFGSPVSAEIEVGLMKAKEGFRLSICGALLIKECEKLGLHAVETGGQCLDSMVEYLANNGLQCKTVEKILPIWKAWHLNDTHAGTERQDECLRKYREQHPAVHVDYDLAREILKDHKILFDDQYIVDGKPYEYGTKWLFREIPQEVLKKLCRILDEVDGYLLILPTKEKEAFLANGK